MARPRQTQQVITLNTKITLRPGEDDDLLGWFATIPPRERAKAIITALRQGGVTAVSVAYEDTAELETMANLMVF